VTIACAIFLLIHRGIAHERVGLLLGKILRARFFAPFELVLQPRNC
jgi:hypothetical protein